MIEVYVWLGLVIAFVVIEAITMQLVSIWFALAALVAMIIAYFGANVAIQLGVFAVVSAVLLYFAMPAGRKFLGKNKQTTNADRIIGQIAMVTEDIDPITETGQIKVLHQSWSAKTVGSDKIPKDTQVKVIEIEGVRAVVEPVS